MPSPIGHALAGAAIGLLAEPTATPSTLPTARWRWPLFGAALATLPDADLLIPHFHRSATHSLFATLIVLIVTTAVTRQVTGKVDIRMVCALTLAYASHLLLDWLGADPNPPSGIQLLWPISVRSFISGADLFPGTERRLWHPDLVATNLRALRAELLWLAPLALAAWWAMRRRRSRGRTCGRDIPLPPSV